MKTDRKLLELAAKAAGKVLVRHAEPGDAFTGVLVEGDGFAPSEKWDPLADDGDALRLAVKLRIELFVYLGYARATNTSLFSAMEDISLPDKGIANDPYAATRRAIVRAAAAIGEQL